ncbi:MAG TPA: aminotransferase class I/II-fold pyridoxal phosphate-dependent enzyme, partial [Desulfuromonadales bacterium]|nr:aminotransferase class I/II-fold pyridoxal phosphate-dependent enzyme [Desulfuromonadales bacterium]
ALAAATAALGDQQHLHDNTERIRETRRWFTEQLKDLGYEVIPSQANFVFTSPPDRDGERVYEALFERRILVRYFSDPLLRHGMRITIGTREQMERTAAALREIG